MAKLGLACSLEIVDFSMYFIVATTKSRRFDHFDVYNPVKEPNKRKFLEF